MKKAAKIVNIIAVMLTALFFAYSKIIGGDAFTGISAPRMAENYVAGAYYVSNHGIYTQVTYAQWILSFVITSAFWAALISALIVNIIAVLKKQPHSNAKTRL